jgi:hypothetical protein
MSVRNVLCVLACLLAVALVRGDSNFNVSLITGCDVCDSLGLTTVGTDQWVSDTNRRVWLHFVCILTPSGTHAAVGNARTRSFGGG